LLLNCIAVFEPPTLPDPPPAKDVVAIAFGELVYVRLVPTDGVDKLESVYNSTLPDEG